MGQIVVQVTDQTLTKMKDNYQNELRNPPPGAAFSAKKAGITITGYKSGKVLFQGANPEMEASKWGNLSTGQTKPKSASTQHPYSPEPSLYRQSLIGSDEAGTGDYFGPITVAAAYVKADQIELLKELGVRDSKNLTDASIQQIAQQILLLDIPYSLVILHNPKYNQLQAKGWTQGKMKTMLHHTAIENVRKKIAPEQPDGILIDQFCLPNIYMKHLKSEQKTLPKSTYFVTKAESHSIAVATASIIARASFVKQMDLLSNQVEFTLPKGASAKVDQVASRVIRQKGKTYLDQVAKVHFANTAKAFAYLKK
ncbi:ribonuclease HIII [Amphibacillus marinus]|uniref:Ribonuclease HIII n=1 Tax=Amphibacillus marinus TaxID=872970 RepID=A0A1H8SSU5_9BACI|nr:ribonuclease HIII [Amphibacillus marinus]SEO81424.1 ribonuclease HIII [Amphibacillus marinus]